VLLPGNFTNGTRPDSNRDPIVHSPLTPLRAVPDHPSARAPTKTDAACAPTKTERRRFPRIKLHQPAEIESRDGARVRATVIDLSQDGLQLLLDGPALRQVCPRGHLTSPADGIRLAVRIVNTDSVATAPRFEADCKVVHIRRLSQLDYRAGLLFEDLSERTQKRLAYWLSGLGESS
jgi:hypothetical protein